MPAAPELKLIVQERRGAIDVFTMWLPRLALIAAFVFIGATKFNDNPNGMWFKLFEQIGFGQWFRYFAGVMQVGGALLMLTPWTLTLGAAMLACTMVGAMITDIFVMHAVGYALVPLILLGMITAVWFNGRIGAGAPQT
jgi:putative oxidoreductase